MAETKHTRESVNKVLKRTNIRGKDYIDVAQRINGFWELFPEGRITTEWLEKNTEWCMCQATVWNMDAILAQGTAYEVKGASNINKTSYIENCETSAIGRALGIAGIGSTESVASADEIAGAISQQEKPRKQQQKPMKEAAWDAVKAFAANNGLDPKGVFMGIRDRSNFEDTDAFWTAIVMEFSK